MCLYYCAVSFSREKTENGMPVLNWNMDWMESLKYCIKNYGVYFIDNFLKNCEKVLTGTWTRYFRQMFTVALKSTDEVDFIPKKCGTLRYDVSAEDVKIFGCNQTLPYYLCEIENMTTGTTYKTSINQPTTKRSARNITTGTTYKTSIHQHTTKRATWNITTGTTYKTNIHQHTTTRATWNIATGTTYETSIHQHTTKRSARSQPAKVETGSKPSTIETGSSSTETPNKTTVQTRIIKYATEEFTVSTGNTGNTKRSTEYTEVMDKMKSSGNDHIPTTGIIIGVVVGVILIALSIGILIFVYKKRNRTEAKLSSGDARQVANEAYNDAFEVTHSTHDAPGLEFSVGDSSGTVNQEYAVVQKTKRNKDVNSLKIEETYNEASNEDYDHLNEIDKRRIRLSDNTYDSNIGLRNISDPTYDTSQSTTRMLDNRNDVYDHFLETSVVSSDDNYAVSYPVKIKNKNDIYD